MEPRCSLAHTQQPATCPYPEADQLAHDLPVTFFKIQLNIILQSPPSSSKWSLFCFHVTPSPHYPVCTSLSPTHATCPTHLILLDLIKQTVFGNEYKSFSSSLCYFTQSPPNWSLISPNILLSIQCSTIGHPQSMFFPQYKRPSFTHLKKNHKNCSSVYFITIFQHFRLTIFFP